MVQGVVLFLAGRRWAYDQGVKFDTVVIRSRNYNAFRFLEAQFGGDVGEVQFIYCGIGPREAGWWAYEAQVGRL